MKEWAQWFSVPHTFKEVGPAFRMLRASRPRIHFGYCLSQSLLNPISATMLSNYDKIYSPCLALGSPELSDKKNAVPALRMYCGNLQSFHLSPNPISSPDVLTKHSTSCPDHFVQRSPVPQTGLIQQKRMMENTDRCTAMFCYAQLTLCGHI